MDALEDHLSILTNDFTGLLNSASAKFAKLELDLH
jgi:hypothetical protein